MLVILMALLRESAWLTAPTVKQPMASHILAKYTLGTPSNVLRPLSSTYIHLYV